MRIDWETLAIPISALAASYVASLLVPGLMVWVVFLGWFVLCCHEKTPHDQ